MSWNNNIYYNPEKFGLSIVGEIEFDEPNYSFDFGVVWKTKNNKFYYGHDSGCSCPTPFEDEGIDDLEGPFDKAEIIAFLTELQPYEYATNASFQEDRVAVISRIVNT